MPCGHTRNESNAYHIHHRQPIKKASDIWKETRNNERHNKIGKIYQLWNNIWTSLKRPKFEQSFLKQPLEHYENGEMRRIKRPNPPGQKLQRPTTRRSTYPEGSRDRQKLGVPSRRDAVEERANPNQCWQRNGKRVFKKRSKYRVCHSDRARE